MSALGSIREHQAPRISRKFIGKGKNSSIFLFHVLHFTQTKIQAGAISTIINNPIQNILKINYFRVQLLNSRTFTLITNDTNP